jgi:hypothetical protein
MKSGPVKGVQLIKRDGSANGWLMSGFAPENGGLLRVIRVSDDPAGS